MSANVSSSGRQLTPSASWVSRRRPGAPAARCRSPSTRSRGRSRVAAPRPRPGRPRQDHPRYRQRRQPTAGDPPQDRITLGDRRRPIMRNRAWSAPTRPGGRARSRGPGRRRPARSRRRRAGSARSRGSPARVFSPRAGRTARRRHPGWSPRPVRPAPATGRRSVRCRPWRRGRPLRVAGRRRRGEGHGARQQRHVRGDVDDGDRPPSTAAVSATSVPVALTWCIRSASRTSRL
jgi:hypothetical protein